MTPTQMQVKSVIFGLIAMVAGTLVLLETDRKPKTMMASFALFFSLGILASNPFFGV